MTDKEIFEKLEAEIERLENYENESVTSSDTRFGWIHGKTFALTSIRVLLDSMQKEPKECMYSKDNYTDKDRKVLCEDCKEKCAYAIAGVISTNAHVKKEPVSEDMWEASKQYALRQVLASTDAEMSEQDYLGLRLFSGFELAVAHKDGAQLQKQQMMKDAFSAEIGKLRPDYKCVLNGNFFEYDTGDKVKVLIIKED